MNEEPLSEQPQNEQPLSQARGPRRLRLGCLTRIVVVILAAIGLVILIGVAFDQGDDAKQPVTTANAGAAEQYARGDVSFGPENTYIVRLEDGDFLALYDRSPKQQEVDGPCRVSFDEQAQLLGLPQLPGFDGAFVEECEGLRTVWRADGQFANGAGYGNLDKFDTEINDEGDLIVKLNSRTCTRSRGVIGAPPFIERRCGKPE